MSELKDPVLKLILRTDKFFSQKHTRFYTWAYVPFAFWTHTFRAFEVHVCWWYHWLMKDFLHIKHICNWKIRLNELRANLIKHKVYPRRDREKQYLPTLAWGSLKCYNCSFSLFSKKYEQCYFGFRQGYKILVTKTLYKFFLWLFD